MLIAAVEAMLLGGRIVVESEESPESSRGQPDSVGGGGGGGGGVGLISVSCVLQLWSVMISSGHHPHIRELS